MSKRRLLFAVAAAASIPAAAPAAPYASNVTISATTVTFVLNEGGTTLTYSINGGAPIALDGSTAGTKTFNLTSPSDTFSITAIKVDPVGYRIPTGATTPAASGGLSQPTANGGYQLVSSDANPLGRYNSPRGISVQNDPNAGGGAQFGIAYISNSAAGSVAANGALPARTLGNGIYAIKADVSDAFGYGDTAQNPGGVFDSVAASSSSPYRLTVARDGGVYVADWSDQQGNAHKLNSNLTTGTAVFAGIGGPSTLPPGQNHGSVPAIHVIPGAGGAVTVYTLDEDLTTAQVTGSGSTTDLNSLWRYDIPAPGTLPFGSMPTKISQSQSLLPIAGVTVDMTVGRDGKFYLAQLRSAGNESGVVVLNPDGTTAFDSLTASRTLLNDPTAVDILRNVGGIALNEDQSLMALMLNNSDVAVVPLINGIPDIANRLLIDTGTDINSGRDIAFDAAGNIYYVSSGQAVMRILSPGGNEYSQLSWNGTAFSFTTNPVPEPSTLALVGVAGVGLAYRRFRRRR